MRILRASGLSSAVLVAAACGASALPAPARHSPASPYAEAAPERRVATSLSDDPLASVPTAPAQEHNHHAHHGGMASAADGGVPPATVEYVCPMHPDVRQAQPGNCPRCGMRLVAKPIVGGNTGKRDARQSDTVTQADGEPSHEHRR